MEYILFIHNNVDTPTSDTQWSEFFVAARESGIFRGGSEIANSTQLGNKSVALITDSIGGFMRFDSDDIGKLLQLLELHPTLVQGGTLELCEMPKT